MPTSELQVSVISRTISFAEIINGFVNRFVAQPEPGM